MKIKDYKRLFRLWAKRRKSFEDYINFQIFRANLLHDELKPYLKDKKNLLDIGSHRGGYSIAFAKLGYNVKGIDFNKDRIKTAINASKKYNVKIKFFLADAREMPFKDSSFNIVLLSNAIEHIPKTNTLLKEIYRVLKPRGILYIQFPPYWGFFGGHIYFKTISLPLHYLPRKLLNIMINTFKLESEFNEIEKITIDKLIKLSEQSGFSIIKIKTIPSIMSRLNKIRELAPFCKAILEK